MLNIKELVNKLDNHIQTSDSNILKLPGRNENDAPISFLIFENSLPKYVIKSTRFSEYSKKIENEYDNLKNLSLVTNCSNFPEVVDAGVCHGCFYFIMEYMPGVLKSSDKIPFYDFSLPFNWLEAFQQLTTIDRKAWCDLDIKKEWSFIFELDAVNSAKYFQILFCDEPPSYCLVHGDFNNCNILWEKDKVNIIDWEYSRKWYSYFDPCFYLAQYLIEVYGKERFIQGMMNLYKNAIEQPNQFILRNLPFMCLFLQDIHEFDFGSHSFSLQDENLLVAALNFEINKGD